MIFDSKLGHQDQYQHASLSSHKKTGKSEIHLDIHVEIIKKTSKRSTTMIDLEFAFYLKRIE